MLELIDRGKIRKRVSEIDLKLQEIEKLVDEKKQLEKVTAVIDLYYSYKSKYELVREVKEHGSMVKKYPFRSEQVAKRFLWLNQYPFIALNLGWEQAEKFVSAHGATEHRLAEMSQEATEQYIANGFADRTEAFLKKFLKSKAQLAEASLSNA